MPIDRKTVEYVTRLCRIELEEKELDKLSGQLRQILDFIDKLNVLDVKDINPTSHILPIDNVLRQDAPAESLTSEKSLQNAPDRQGSFFGVPKVIE
jgi:aspartyl-tRNA(Asn)/glutamyl-tRNA(Gln) amidotransferase subunit C